MGKPYIVIGDKTSHGGTVVEGSATSTINGKKIACVGHKVTCPIPGHGTNPIVVGDPDWSIDGQMVARHGDTSACGATLIATQALASDDEGGASGEAGSPAVSKATPISTSSAAAPIADKSSASLKPEIEKKIYKNLAKGDLKEVHAIVLHRTGGATAASTLSNYANSGIGAHFLIDTDGHIYQTIDTSKKAAHVGKLRSRCLDNGNCSAEDRKQVSAIWNDLKQPFSTRVAEIHKIEIKKGYPARYPSNDDSIGIEVVGASIKDPDSYVNPSSAQVFAVKSLVNYLQHEFSLADNDVYTHARISYKSGNEGEGLGY